jgi:hypothetical protein
MNAKVTPRRPELILDENIEKLPICMTSRRGRDDVHVCLQPKTMFYFFIFLSKVQPERVIRTRSHNSVLSKGFLTEFSSLKCT